jgi:ubinuclein
MFAFMFVTFDVEDVLLLMCYQVNEQQDGSADDFQAVPEEGRDLKGKFAMDSALEDRMCDLYDLYVEV